MTTPPNNNELRDLVVRCETKLDMLLLVKTDHEERLRALERSRWPLPSLAVIVSLASFILAFLVATGTFR